MVEKFEKGQLPLHLYSILGTMFVDGERGGMEMNAERGSEIWMAGAEKGDPCCQFMIGAGYQEGNGGLPRSPSEAKKWLAAATEQGHAIAELFLANMLKHEGSDAEYLQLVRGSSSKGFDDACFALGLHY